VPAKGESAALNLEPVRLTPVARAGLIHQPDFSASTRRHGDAEEHRKFFS